MFDAGAGRFPIIAGVFVPFRPNHPVVIGLKSIMPDPSAFSDAEALHGDSAPAIRCVVDVCDRTDLFDMLDNRRICELSSMGAGSGFSCVDSIQKSTGVAQRRILRPGVTPLKVATELILKLAAETGLELSDFDQIFLCHSHCDSQAAARLARELASQFPAGLEQIRALNGGCAGYLLLIDEACRFLDESNGLGADAKVLLLNVETPEFWHDASDRLFCGIVAAGATATVVQRGGGWALSRAQADHFPPYAELRTTPGPLFWKDQGTFFTFRGQSQARTVMRMNAEAVFLNGIELMLNCLRTMVTAAPEVHDRRVIVVPHQPSGKLLKALIAAARTEFPRFEFLNNLKDYGNMISAGIPLILSRLPEVLAANGRTPPESGDMLILLGAGICMEDIAEQMTAGCACLEWSPLPAMAGVSL